MFQFCWSESYSENTKREYEREKTVATTAIEVRVNENCVVKSRQESVLVIDVNDGDYDNIGFSANSNTHFFLLFMCFIRMKKKKQQQQQHINRPTLAL